MPTPPDEDISEADETELPKFKVGDVVHLKSDFAIHMCVSLVEYELATCVWFDSEQTLQSADIPMVCLVKVEA